MPLIQILALEVLVISKTFNDLSVSFNLSSDRESLIWRPGNQGVKYFFRYVYRFVCDLQELIGCPAEQLHHMLDIQPEADEK